MTPSERFLRFALFVAYRAGHRGRIGGISERRFREVIRHTDPKKPEDQRFADALAIIESRLDETGVGNLGPAEFREAMKPILAKMKDHARRPVGLQTGSVFADCAAKIEALDRQWFGPKPRSAK